jgi:hypothetical protein
MPHLPILLFLLVVLAGSLPAFSRTCCYPASFQPSPPYDYGCVCIDAYDNNVRVEFVYDPSDPFFYYAYSFCSSMFASCENVFLNCRVSDSGVIDCFSSSSSEDNPSFSCSSFPCFLDYIPDFGGSGSGSGAGSGSGFACQSVYDLIDTFQGVKEGFLKVFIGSSFAFGLLGGAYAVLRVVF